MMKNYKNYDRQVGRVILSIMLCDNFKPRLRSDLLENRALDGACCF